MRVVSVMFACLAAFAAFAGEEESLDRGYAGFGASLVLPQGARALRRLGGACVRAGYYLTDAWALEGSVAALEDRAGLSVGALWHWHGWDEFNLLFGYERFDPFFAFGAKGWLADGDVGPCAGIGALYYLSDAWALRGDADLTLGLEREVGAVFSLSFGLQYSF